MNKLKRVQRILNKVRTSKNNWFVRFQKELESKNIPFEVSSVTGTKYHSGDVDVKDSNIRVFRYGESVTIRRNKIKVNNYPIVKIKV